MAIASITLALFLVPTSTFLLIFPICQITFAQENATQSTEDIQNTATFNTIIAAISGGLVGAAATLIGTYLNNKHNMNLKKQELKHYLAIELLKHRIECYALVIKYIEPVAHFSSKNFVMEAGKLAKNLKNWSNQEKGGLLMSENSARLFNAFIFELVEVWDKIKTKSDIDEEVQQIKVASERFYVSLLRDIGVREEIPKS